MDLLRDVFKSIRLEGSIFFNSKLTAPWDLRLDASNRPRFHLVVQGCTWLQCSSSRDPMCLRRSEAVFLNDGGPHRLSDMPSKLTQRNTAALTTGIASNPECHLICGTFGFDDELKHPLIDTLPGQIRFSITEDHSSLWAMIRIMVDELDQKYPGSTVVVDRLCELLLIYLLRLHARDNPVLPGFVAALDDPITSKGLQLIHERPEVDWTLDSLAQAAGLSRAAFAKRFHQLVGIPPKAYLTTWRMHQAKRLLKNPYARMANVARQVGYSSDATFIRAFKQFFGKSPGAFKSENMCEDDVLQQ